MTINEFESQISDEIKKSFDSEVSLKFDSVLKDNDVSLRACVIREPGMNLAPVIYLDEYYDSCSNGSLSIVQAAHRITDIYYSHKADNEFDPGIIEDYEKVKTHLIARLLNRDANKLRLAKIPFLPVMDLAVVFSYTTEMFGRDASITITHEILREWGVSLCELYKTAMANTREKLGVKSIPLDEYLIKITNDDTIRLLFDQDFCIKMPYVQTNNSSYYGAVTMLFTDKLDELAALMQDDLVILPTSVHEVLILAASSAQDSCYLSNMIQTINVESVDEKERLSSHPYYYSRERKILDIMY